ncbi:MAG: hypothetical protein ABW277_09445 [Longimicrobiaceae bacterium]
MLPQLSPRQGCSVCLARLERLGWKAGLAVAVQGARIGVRATGPDVLDRVRERLPPGWKPSSARRVDELYSLVVGDPGAGSHFHRYHLLYAGAARLARSTRLDEVLEVLEDDLHYAAAFATRTRLFVRAGVVGWGGRALLVLGHGRSGTTSLVAALVRAGAAYYSDEFAVLDARGRAHPYPVTPSVGGGDGAPPRELPLRELGGRAGVEPIPVALVAVARYAPGARWRPRALSPGQAVLAMLERSLLAGDRTAFALESLGCVAAGADALACRRGEAREAAGSLIRRLERASGRQPGDRVPVSPSG